MGRGGGCPSSRIYQEPAVYEALEEAFYYLRPLLESSPEPWQALMMPEPQTRTGKLGWATPLLTAAESRG